METDDQLPLTSNGEVRVRERVIVMYLYSRVLCEYRYSSSSIVPVP